MSYEMRVMINKKQFYFSMDHPAGGRVPFSLACLCYLFFLQKCHARFLVRFWAKKKEHD